MSTLAWGGGALGTAFAPSLHMVHGSFSFSNFVTLWGLRERNLNLTEMLLCWVRFFEFCAMLEWRKKVQKTSQKPAFLLQCCGGLRGES